MWVVEEKKPSTTPKRAKEDQAIFMYLFRNIRKNEEKETETATKISPQLANLGLSVRIFMAIYTNFIYGIILYFCFSCCA